MATKPETPYDPMNDMVSVSFPRATGSEEDFVFVGLNGKGYTIRRGVQVMVPRPVYNILAESQRQQTRQAEFDQKMKDLPRERLRQYGI